MFADIFLYVHNYNFFNSLYVSILKYERAFVNEGLNPRVPEVTELVSKYGNSKKYTSNDLLINTDAYAMITTILKGLSTAPSFGI